MLASYDDIKTKMDRFKRDEKIAYKGIIKGLARFIKLTLLLRHASTACALTPHEKKYLKRRQPYKLSAPSRVYFTKRRQLDRLKRQYLTRHLTEVDVLKALKKSQELRSKIWGWRASAENMRRGLDRACDELANKLVEIEQEISQHTQHTNFLISGEHHALALGQVIYEHSPLAAAPIMLDWANQKMNALSPRRYATEAKLAMTLITLLVITGFTLENPLKVILLFLLPAAASMAHYALPGHTADYQQATLSWKPSVMQIQLIEGMLISSAIACMTEEYSLMAQTLATMGAGMVTFVIGNGVAKIISQVIPMTPVDQFVLSKIIAMLSGLVGYQAVENVWHECELRHLIKIEFKGRDAYMSGNNTSTWHPRYLLKRYPARVSERYANEVSIFSCILDKERLGERNPLDCQIVSSQAAIGYNPD